MFPLTVQVLCIIASSAAIICIINGNVVSSFSDRFCSTSSYTSTCPGDIKLLIALPFWIEHRTVDDMGECTTYPGFQIKCAANGRAVMNISNNHYYVLDFEMSSESGGRLTIMDVVMDAQKCPQPRRNISLESVEFLNISKSQNTNMTIFYNCSSHPKNVVQNVPCLENYSKNTGTGRQTFAFYDDTEIASSRFNWFEYCELTVVVPVTRKYSSADHLRNTSYTEALKHGVTMDWQQPCPGPHCKCPLGMFIVDGQCSSPAFNIKYATIGGIIIYIGILLVLLFCLVICIRCCWLQFSSIPTRAVQRE